MTNLIEWILHEGAAIILFLVVLMLVFIPWFFNPQAVLAFTAKGKVDELAYVINDVCLTGGTGTIKDFSLPQDKKAEQITLIQEFITKVSGDPSFVLYYEAFPPGEALGWEIYHRDFGYRLFVPYVGPDIDLDADPKVLSYFLNGFEENGRIVQEGVKQKATAFREAEYAREDEKTREKLMEKTLVAYFSNIILNGKLDFSTGVLIEENKAGLGEWQDMGSESEMFSFTNYAGAGNLDKTAIKHMPCGDNSLCLKTKQGVVAYSLNNCAANGFDLIVLKDNANMLAFHMASPCKGDLTISAVQDCSGLCKPNDETYFEKLPLYSMDANKLTQTGEHWRCVYGTNKNEPPMAQEEPDKCILVELKKKKDYCYTPYEVSADWWKEIVSFGFLSGMPIKDMRYYLPDIKSFLLRPNLMEGVPTFDLIAGWVWP